MTSLERFIALRHPLVHRRSVTRRKVICGTVVLVLLSTIPVSVYVYLNPNPSPLQQLNGAFIGFFIFDNSLNILGVIMVQTLLLLTYLTIRKSVQKKLFEARTSLATSRHRSIHFTNTIRKESRRESRVIHLFMTIALVYFLTFLPNSIFNIVIKIGGVGLVRKLGPVLFYRWQIGLFALLVSPAIFDPLLTLYMKHDYQLAIINLFRRQRKRESCQTYQVSPTFTIAEESAM